ncbi:Deoxyribonuclease-2-alpha [Trichinella nativa]|uniref:Deoxyribonuclease-2-alpha n=1 Tax=Trichinella nativa TaxID=6335 RepID=A0A0V1L5R3_9BILA|nr:Deoxyribonuclease-2-alpha [Trichinella nativa]
MNIYIASGNKPNTNIVAYSNYPPHFKFELPMSPGKGVIMAVDNNKGFWLVHTAKYFPNLALAITDLFSNEKTTKEAAAFLCMPHSDANLRASAKIIDYEQPIVFFAQKSATVPALYDSTEIQKLVNGLHKYQPTAYASGDGVATLTPAVTVKIFASAPVGYSSDIYSNYVVKILRKSFQVYTPGTTATVLRKSCVGTLKVENVLGPITVRDTTIPIGQDSARWSVPKSDSDFICLSNTGRTLYMPCPSAQHPLNSNALKLLILFFVYKLPGGKSSHRLLPNAAADWSAAETIDDAQKPIHATMDKYFSSQNKPNTNIIAYSNYPPHFKFELPMSPGKALYTLHLGVTPIDYQCKEQNNDVLCL